MVLCGWPDWIGPAVESMGGFWIVVSRPFGGRPTVSAALWRAVPRKWDVWQAVVTRDCCEHGHVSERQPALGVVDDQPPILWGVLAGLSELLDSHSVVTSNT